MLVEHLNITVPSKDRVPNYGDLVGYGAKTLVINEDPYEKKDWYMSMAFIINEAWTLELEDGKAKSVFVEFHVPVVSTE